MNKYFRFREKSRIFRNRQRQGPKFSKLREAICRQLVKLTVINEIFKLAPHL